MALTPNFRYVGSLLETGVLGEQDPCFSVMLGLTLSKSLELSWMERGVAVGGDAHGECKVWFRKPLGLLMRRRSSTRKLG